MSKSEEKRQSSVLSSALGNTEIGPGMWVLPGQGNVLAVSTDDGVVMTDAGNPLTAPAMAESLRGFTDEPLAAIIYSHGHGQYNAAVPWWREHNAQRGDAPPRLIGHERILARYARYRETAGLQARTRKVQFPTRDDMPLAVYRRGVDEDNYDPDEVFDDRLTVVDGSRKVEVIWAPSETDDSVAVWYPDDGLLFGGPATPGDAIPNIGTPLRTQRFTIRWAETLEKLASLGAERLLTEFGPLVEGGDAVHQRLTMTAEALRWLRAEVVDRMNRGMDELEIIADLDYPPELFDQPWMNPNYGDPDYIARDLFREENGWWDRNPTSLHPSPPDVAAAAVLDAIGDPAAVVARARALAADGDTQLALHVIDVVALAPGNDGVVGEAKELKADLLLTRAGEIEPYVSKGLYRSMATLLRRGETSWQALS